MPSRTPKQARTMAAAAHDPAFTKKVGIPQRVAKEFSAADAGTEILKPPRHKHRGALGDAMRKSHNAKRMNAVRAHKAK